MEILKEVLLIGLLVSISYTALAEHPYPALADNQTASSWGNSSVPRILEIDIPNTLKLDLESSNISSNIVNISYVQYGEEKYLELSLSPLETPLENTSSLEGVGNCIHSADLAGNIVLMCTQENLNAQLYCGDNSEKCVIAKSKHK